MLRVVRLHLMLRVVRLHLMCSHATSTCPVLCSKCPGGKGQCLSDAMGMRLQLGCTLRRVRSALPELQSLLASAEAERPGASCPQSPPITIIAAAMNADCIPPKGSYKAFFNAASSSSSRGDDDEAGDGAAGCCTDQGGGTLLVVVRDAGHMQFLAEAQTLLQRRVLGMASQWAGAGRPSGPMGAERGSYVGIVGTAMPVGDVLLRRLAGSAHTPPTHPCWSSPAPSPLMPPLPAGLHAGRAPSMKPSWWPSPVQ
jgi:hypothetical protein